MKQLFKLFMGGAIAAMVLMISACSSNDLEETVQQPVPCQDPQTYSRNKTRRGKSNIFSLLLFRKNLLFIWYSEK